MFGMFKRKAEPGLVPSAPIELKVAIEIDRSAEDVYALLDWDDERNQMRARGQIVRRESEAPDVYRLWYDRAPHLNFIMTVIAAHPAREYAFRAQIVPRVGRRIDSVESYSLEPLGAASCRVTFVNAIRHVAGLTTAQLQEEIGRSSVAAANALTKLKLQAEQGAAAVENFEREMGQR